MDIDKLSKEQKEIFTERVDYYITTAQYGLDSQSNSFNAVDSKNNYLLTSLAVFITIPTVILGVNSDFFTKYNLLENFSQILMLFLIVSYILALVTTFVLGFITNMSTGFSIGRDINRIRDLDNFGLSNVKIKKDISDGFEISFKKNQKALQKKTRLYRLTQSFCFVIMVLTIILSIIITVI